ncbi:hypothetical protein [Mariniflexile maritimum]|uniref:hypothetical protein n=1 Tax=Mariniflexile maritimum TaxID=2682493 RepID=UPI001E5AD614|nr:hypothetical protein [Mariniflexile maritimum]HMQ43382.1 hypothetical protein [Mariniflexile sp.]HMR15161.1 hypothetical protein [Mariniflexile sp.]
MMKQICVFIIVLTLTSCEYFNVKKTSSDAILNEELQTFNWNEVDVYPSFSTCDALELKSEKTACFNQVLTTHILEYLQKVPITVTHDVTDTINLKFQVSETGTLSLLNIEVDSLVTREIPNIKALIHSSLDSLPKVYPAIKRGQQVKTEFELPIIVHAN